MNDLFSEKIVKMFSTMSLYT